MSVYSERHQSQTGCFGYGCCFRFRRECAEVLHFPVNPDVCLPLSLQSVPTDTTVARGRVAVTGAVLRLATFRYDAKVDSTVVEFDSVDVIDLPLVMTSESEQFTVQPERNRKPSNILTSCSVPLLIEPAPLSYEGDIGNVYTGVPLYGATTSMKRDQRRLAIDIKNRRTPGFLCVDAHLRTHTGSRTEGSTANVRRSAAENFAACEAGTLYGHRDHSSVSPRTFLRRGGHSATQNCTSFLRVGWCNGAI